MKLSIRNTETNCFHFIVFLGVILDIHGLALRRNCRTLDNLVLYTSVSEIRFSSQNLSLGFPLQVSTVRPKPWPPRKAKSPSRQVKCWHSTQHACLLFRTSVKLGSLRLKDEHSLRRRDKTALAKIHGRKKEVSGPTGRTA
jgi:hypothetical protein